MRTSQYIFLHDLIGISVGSGRDYLPPFYFNGRRPLPFRELETRYSTSIINPIQGWPRDIANDSEYNQLLRYEIGAIVSEPLIYLKNRSITFLTLLGLLEKDPRYRKVYAGEFRPYWLNLKENKSEAPEFNLGFRTSLVSWVNAHPRHLLFQGWFYLLLLVIEMGLGLRWGARDRGMFVSVGLSGLVYLISYFFLAPSTVFRYLWWPMAVTTILPVLIRLPPRASEWALRISRHLALIPTVSPPPT